MEENQQQVENQLIDSARRILEIHYTHYNRIDQKAQWFLTLMGAVEGYFVINFFLNWKFDITDSSWILMLISLLIGAVVIILYISILQSRPFYNGPNIEAQADDFRPDGKIEDVRKDTLATLKISYQENIKIINQKAKLFKISIRGICLYFISLIVYFGVLKMNENEIPTDILLWTDQTIMTTNTIPAPVEEQLTTDNVGAVEANENEVETTEQQDEKSTISKEEKSAEENASELSSDNLDITESTSQ